MLMMSITNHKQKEIKLLLLGGSKYSLNMLPVLFDFSSLYDTIICFIQYANIYSCETTKNTHVTIPWL